MWEEELVLTPKHGEPMVHTALYFTINQIPVDDAEVQTIVYGFDIERRRIVEIQMDRADVYSIVKRLKASREDCKGAPQ